MTDYSATVWPLTNHDQGPLCAALLYEQATVTTVTRTSGTPVRPTRTVFRYGEADGTSGSTYDPDGVPAAADIETVQQI
jgi:hypothetical protein